MSWRLKRILRISELNSPDFIELHSADASRMHIFTLYFLDSGSYQRKTLPWVNADYDYIKE